MWNLAPKPESEFLLASAAGSWNEMKAALQLQVTWSCTFLKQTCHSHSGGMEAWNSVFSSDDGLMSRCCIRWLVKLNGAAGRTAAHLLLWIGVFVVAFFHASVSPRRWTSTPWSPRTSASPPRSACRSRGTTTSTLWSPTSTWSSPSVTRRRASPQVKPAEWGGGESSWFVMLMVSLGHLDGNKWLSQ